MSNTIKFDDLSIAIKNNLYANLNAIEEEKRSLLVKDDTVLGATIELNMTSEFYLLAINQPSGIVSDTYYYIESQEHYFSLMKPKVENNEKWLGVLLTRNNHVYHILYYEGLLESMSASILKEDATTIFIEGHAGDYDPINDSVKVIKAADLIDSSSGLLTINTADKKKSDTSYEMMFKGIFGELLPHHNYQISGNFIDSNDTTITFTNASIITSNYEEGTMYAATGEIYNANEKTTNLTMYLNCGYDYTLGLINADGYSYFAIVNSGIDIKTLTITSITDLGEII